MIAERRVIPGPVFRDLTSAERTEVLANNSVGRLAFSFHDRVDVEPLHYVVDDGWIYFRTQPGSKLTTLAHHPWAALEVDEIQSAFNWRSVVAHGPVRVLDGEGSTAERERYQKALAALTSRSPAMFTDDDPAPFRSVIVGMHVAELTGRAAAWPDDPSR
jgi:nitroimidazol reductase NimA-like FMN-containing flavoprotein (pyridoxamine 5'-phosphate oxidase superfamily)